MSQSIFREVSLERLSSPEQLDELIKVTSPRAWFALIAMGCILISAIVWGFLGSIPTKIEGRGILLNSGGVSSIQHHTSGQVIDLRVKSGDMVKKGDVVARIELPELVAKINSLQSTLYEMKSNQRVDSPEYKAVENQVIQLREELDYKSQIVSQIDGRILELNITKGSFIQPGESLVTLDEDDGTVKMEAVIYVPAEQGAIILPGMEAQISPTIVNKEEYGFMLGRVISVSDYPATTKSMMQTLGNENLVSLLAGQGASLMIRVDLIPDQKTESGYKWSTAEGPPMSIDSGTLIQSSVITNREKPMSKVIPLLRSVKQ
ncbi:NHLP bacteriocin system secretion protein [Desulfosporosinus fructosivorans]|uniref:NHLP bacteriocin system secretion protein n=1 Tax=Desulfosporosinus fructosivorans TaxID=2018669 RepID=A0A4Z0R4N6_9FIRM|nr:NHLP bacteriocin system secretion protein [Desulfosporosinus fructosivorans]TGE36586.1 NHLP bacteriocin system secretion protein [Desulfosporosinus fructosivorans]